MTTDDTPTTQPSIDAVGLARLVDHTLLKPEATRADVEALVAEGVRLGVYSVCVSPSFLPLEVPVGLDGAPDLLVATVCGFPSGKHHSDVKAAEAARAVRDGADEVDMVIDVGAAKEGRFGDVQQDIAAVRAAAPAPTVLKVIIESAALTDDEIVGVCQAAEAAGADFVKTSTGFHPAGGATVHAVALMARTVGGRLGVKASGGVRTAADALAMVEAGATRLGLSGTAAVLAGLTADGDY
ncbi:deoxyribose-phosphate aldolase [Cellulomonas dongxiuzhuiae]|uniref:deoxyribose-phosphate aldolase n=1 Tax=Cellulomonas dongxiuzhuiae TaxID=2819979 RepID=UPI001AB003A5|nr:deoxyribose-phosphate aldolase [Cellulomonas dongxiuzhuiae]MBO3089045.1 deoxyribose-phosphate aldolase [Cellulomonas dongxiuzhuiae]